MRRIQTKTPQAEALYSYPAAPLIVVGLGNPGPAYSGSLHNLGRDWVRRLGQKLHLDFVPSARFGGESATLQTDGPSRLLYLPGCWMNESGVPLARVMRRKGCPGEQLLVVHDEMDLPAGRARLKFAGGDAGHNGLRSIRVHLGTGDYWRLRIGIGQSTDGVSGRDFVLSKPAEERRQLIEDAMQRALGLFAPPFDRTWDELIQKLHSPPG